MFAPGRLLLLLGLLRLSRAQARQTQTGVEKRREELRWFPADNSADCDADPGLEQVGGEMGCRHGPTGPGGEAQSGLPDGRGEVLPVRARWRGGGAKLQVGRCSGGRRRRRFLCGICNISFKLDRRKGLKAGAGKKTVAKRVGSASAKKGL
jgi:hypothetical protein